MGSGSLVQLARTSACAAGLAIAVLLPVSMASAASPHVATWTTRLQADGPTQVEDLSCSTALRCVAVGGGASGYGAAYWTDDGGSSWTREPVPGDAGTSALLDVSCPTATFCLTVSEGGGLPFEGSWPIYAVTHDGGVTWSTVASQIDADLSGRLACAGPSRCYALDGTISRSTDGGATWESLTSTAWSSIDQLACTLRSTCFVVGTSHGALSFGRIVGFGARVVRVGALPDLPSLAVESISCSSVTACTIAGTSAGPVSLTTEDGGRTWVTHRLPIEVRNLADLSCSGPRTCTAVGTSLSLHGPLEAATTIDGGVTWTTSEISSDPDGWAARLSCGPGGPCAVAGPAVSENTVSVRRAGGSTWTAHGLPAGPSVLSAVSCATTTACVAVGAGVALRSQDGGADWSTATTPPPTGDSLTVVTCASATTCLAGGWRPTSGAGVASTILRSTDDGATWHASTGVPADPRITAIACPTATTCVAATSGAHLLRSTDGGASWSSDGSTSPSVTGISCGSTSDCIAVTWNGAVYVTHDAGTTWTKSPAYVQTGFGSVSCTSATTCVASGGEPEPDNPGAALPTGVYGTTDGGSSWVLLASPTDASGSGSIDCSGSTCQLVDDEGWTTSTLQTSTDGGATWSPVVFGTSTALPMGATDAPSGGWIVVGGDTQNGAFVATDS